MDGFYLTKRLQESDRIILLNKIDTLILPHLRIRNHFLFKKVSISYTLYFDPYKELKQYKRPFDRNFYDTDIQYEISPRPIALFDNIVRVHETVIEEKDSILAEGILIILNNISSALDSTNFKKRYNINNYNFNSELYNIALIRNNEIIAFAGNFTEFPYKQKNWNKDRFFLTFFFTSLNTEKLLNAYKDINPYPYKIKDEI